MNRTGWALVAALVGLSPPAQAAETKTNVTEAEDAYVYGYPLVLMDATKQSMTSVNTPGPNGSPVNEFFYAKDLPDPAMHLVVRPNLDTLYASAWLDLSEGPVVLHLPEVRDRFYLMELLDAWTNVFAAPGSRTLHGAARDLAIVGPNWHGTLPNELARVDSPTNLAWIIGRTEIKGPNDTANAREISLQFTLQTLAARARGETPARGKAVDLNASTEKPPAAVAKLDGVAFFRRLAQLMRDNPVPLRDHEMLARLARLGVVPGRAFNPPPAAARALVEVPQRALDRIAARADALGELRNGWRELPKNVGAFGDDYETRAAVAIAGLGANLAGDAIYPNTTTDGKNRPLIGSHRYVMHFAPGQAPPVSAFWSLTLYDDRGYLVANDARRYALRDRDPLIKNPDGSIDLYIQHDAPDEKLRANWLPAPAGTFNLMLRLYSPKAPALTGAWTPPPVERANERRAAER